MFLAAYLVVKQKNRNAWVLGKQFVASIPTFGGLLFKLAYSSGYNTLVKVDKGIVHDDDDNAVRIGGVFLAHNKMTPT
jgi:hypothetical protein